MRETREYRIAWRRFDRSVLEGFGNFFLERAGAHADDDSVKYRIRFQVSADDGTTYESDGADLFRVDSVAMLKTPVAVSLEYYAFRFGDGEIPERLSLDLQHGHDEFNRVRVDGLDAAWVQSVFTQIKERVDACPQADNWITRHTAATSLAAILGSGWIANYVVVALLSVLAKAFAWTLPQLPIPNTAPFIFGVTWLGVLLWGSLVWGQVSRWFWAAWPRIELAFGPEHLRLASRRRKALAYLATVVAVPIVLTLALR